ncbi:Protein of unknown function [Bacillus cytotoxicus]|uniref:Uncharacterized protein n=1 Tax=Bacillus cytotoxicus TaxID=580165 RepID=A0AAX2CDB1_9BACI|nr:Protein of unknown function [Bacillus cytotoxicus]
MSDVEAMYMMKKGQNDLQN